MPISDTFKNNIEERDIKSVRLLLISYVLLDTSLKQFKESYDYAVNKLRNELYDEFDNAKFKDSLEWNEDYFFKVSAHLKKNFAKKRIDHMCEVTTVVFKNSNDNVSMHERDEVERDKRETLNKSKNLDSSNSSVTYGRERIISEREIPKTPYNKSKKHDDKNMESERIISEREIPGSARSRNQESSSGNRKHETLNSHSSAAPAIICIGTGAAVVGVIASSAVITTIGVLTAGVGGVILATSKERND